ncbi:probable acyl- dehydrogenase IBR3 [Olea europaea subsp. europaea]|uniref:Probable acyl- dehydrogenase IBR3 n=2 Tax=Olea europaea subsp. europaea TaxID=158383 RepID=A0A8S0VEQ7_OLEEU|nr:probable acyl- dehydrogenase IBR3 [Olea europaea subsp. europaea]
MASRTSELVGRVDPAQSFNTDALLRYASVNVEAFPQAPTQFKVSQFGHGQSNPTFLMEVHSGSSVKRYVMRKKPHGKLLESAHAIEREFQVLHALGTHTLVPVPKVFCLCKDSNVIGTPFYIMEYLEGRIYIDPKLPGVEPKQRRAIYHATAKALASLHSADVDAISLGNFGKRNYYCKRQVERWAKQYLVSTGEGKSNRNPRMLELIDWLRQHIPLEDSSGATAGLVHGDFRIDNVVFHPIEDRVIGILDWELSTLGNQMCDVAYSCLHYIVNIALDEVQENGGLELTGIPEGVPSLAEYLAYYCSAAGKPWPVAQWKFYIAFSLFRGASIFTGVHCRWIMGNASGGHRARHAGKKADALIEIAWAFIQRKSVLPEHPPSADSISQEHMQQLEKEIRDHTTSTRGKLVPSQKVQHLRNRLIKFMEDHIYPVENEFYELAQSTNRWTVHPKEEKLKELAKREGLWNLWIPFDSAARVKKLISGEIVNKAFDGILGAGLSNLEYGYLCQIMGRSVWAPQVFNCGAPDTGNMEVLMRYGNEEQLHQWLVPLLEGNIRSGFAMTEPQVASSDATNIECSIKRQGDSYIINGRKWWTSGAMDPRCKILIVMGKTNFDAPKHKQQSMILVDINTPGVNIKRPLTVFGFDDAPHGHAEISFENVRVPAKNILLGEGRGFEIAQGRLGPGRLHHCMRLIGAAERGMQMMVLRALSRKAFDKFIAEHGSFLSDVAKCRIELEKTRLLVLEAADQLDQLGNKKARGTIAMAKVAAPNMALKVLDMAMQVHGAAGLSGDTVLAHLWATARTLRIADGPDEVHLGTIAKLELRRARL